MEIINKKCGKETFSLTKLSILLVLIATLSFIYCKKYLDDKRIKENFQEEVYYCRKGQNNYLYKAELNSIDHNNVKVYIEQNHNNISGKSDRLTDFIDEVCEYEKYLFKENQTNYQYTCGADKDTISYNYIGTMSEALIQLEDEGYECYKIEKNGNLQDKIKNKTWCNYKLHKYAFVFDETAKKYGPFNYEYEYSTDDNTIIIHDDGHDIKYIYNEDKNILTEDSTLQNYLFECDAPEENYYLIKEIYYYDGKDHSSMPQSGYYKDDEYKLNHVECTNGVTATFDEDRRILFPSENKKADCNIYFDNLKQ